MRSIAVLSGKGHNGTIGYIDFIEMFIYSLWRIIFLELSRRDLVQQRLYAIRVSKSFLNIIIPNLIPKSVI